MASVVHPLEDKSRLTSSCKNQFVNVDEEISKHINCFFQFKNSGISAELDRFNDANISANSVFFNCIYITIASIFVGLAFFFQTLFFQHVDASDWSIIFGSFFFVSINAGIWCMYFAYQSRNQHISIFQHHQKSLSRLIVFRNRLIQLLTSAWVRRLFMAIFHIYFAIRLIQRVTNGQCEKGRDHYRLCNPVHDFHAVPMESVVVLLVTPVVYSIVLRGGEFEVSLFLSFAASIEIIFCLIHAKAYLSMLWCTYFIFCTFLIIIETRRQNLNAFFHNFLLNNALNENKMMADQIHANEMRHMIANVAHDLKTVSVNSI